jgi:hypothetical protein
MSTRESSRLDDGSRRLRVAVEPDASTSFTTTVRRSPLAKAGEPSAVSYQQ